MNHQTIFDLRKHTFKSVIVLFVFSFIAFNLSAQEEKKATIKLFFEQTDSTRTCKALVTDNAIPVKEKEVHFYVQRMYSLLPIGRAVETDENGEALQDFPLDLPGDKNGNYIVIAKIEDDDTYGNVETQNEIKWGVIPSETNDNWENRSLSASRDKAPMILIIVSNAIISLIWGTIFYVVYQVFRIRKASKMLKTKTE